MRVGKNPAKINSALQLDSYHRIILPVYIPNLEEAYFKNALQILNYCLMSLLKTTHDKSRISIINNGCCKTIEDYLIQMKESHKKIDQLFNSDENLGKINAVYSIVKSNTETLFTVTDADVLFLPEWQQTVEKVFVNFPEAGMVSPVPAPVAYRNWFMNSTYYYGILKNAIKVADVIDPDALLKFQESIDTRLYENIHLKKQLILEKNGKQAALGCGHFVSTLRKEVFEAAPSRPSSQKIGFESDRDYIDKPNDDAGFLRLATIKNYAYHLGNSPEKWMEDDFQKITSTKNIGIYETQVIPPASGYNAVQQLLGKVFYKFFIRTRPIKKQYLKILGINDPHF